MTGDQISTGTYLFSDYLVLYLYITDNLYEQLGATVVPSLMGLKLQCISYTSGISTRVSPCISFTLLKPNFMLQGFQFDFFWRTLGPHFGSLCCLTSSRLEELGQIRADHQFSVVSCCLSVNTVIRELKVGWRRENPPPALPRSPALFPGFQNPFNGESLTQNKLFFS